MSSVESITRSDSSTRDWQIKDHRHYLHPFTDHHDLGERGARIIERAEGVYIYDSDGNQILDGMAGLWNVNLGYGRQDPVDAATRSVGRWRSRAPVRFPPTRPGW